VWTHHMATITWKFRTCGDCPPICRPLFPTKTDMYNAFTSTLKESFSDWYSVTWRQVNHSPPWQDLSYWTSAFRSQSERDMIAERERAKAEGKRLKEKTWSFFLSEREEHDQKKMFRNLKSRFDHMISFGAYTMLEEKELIIPLDTTKLLSEIEKNEEEAQRQIQKEFGRDYILALRPYPTKPSNGMLIWSLGMMWKSKIPVLA